jgi:hypothetical protein
VTGAALARQRQTEQCTQEYTPRRPGDVISEVLTEQVLVADGIEDGDRARAAAIALGLCSQPPNVSTDPAAWDPLADTAKDTALQIRS